MIINQNKRNDGGICLEVTFFAAEKGRFARIVTALMRQGARLKVRATQSKHPKSCQYQHSLQASKTWKSAMGQNTRHFLQPQNSPLALSTERKPMFRLFTLQTRFSFQFAKEVGYLSGYGFLFYLQLLLEN